MHKVLQSTLGNMSKRGHDLQKCLVPSDYQETQLTMVTSQLSMYKICAAGSPEVEGVYWREYRMFPLVLVQSNERPVKVR